MRRTSLFFVLCGSCLALTVLFHWRRVNNSTAQLRIEPTVYDMGSGRPDETLVGHTSLRNVSSQPIRVLNIEKSCGCVSFNPEVPIEIPPRTSVKLHWETRLTRDLGQRVITFSLRTDRAGEQPPRVAAKVNVLPAEYTKPNELLFGDVQRSAGASAPLGVYSTSGAPIRDDELEILDNDREGISVRTNTGSDAQLLVELDKDLSCLGKFGQLSCLI
jgi:hypothetical protein